MNPMRERHRATINELRTAVECLPRHTRVAMLEGIRTNEIIVGAYSRDGGICPMLAAHRAGGRTDFISFAKAWDRFAFAQTRSKRARRATERELLILRTHLEASLLDDDGPAPDLSAAMAEHRALMERRAAEQAAAPQQAAALQQAAAPQQAGAPQQAAAPQPKRGPSRPRPGDPDRSRELRRRGGWSWMRVVRRLDDYERALARLDAAAGEHEHRTSELV
jgi:hypothetical protein